MDFETILGSSHNGHWSVENKDKHKVLEPEDEVRQIHVFFFAFVFHLLKFLGYVIVICNNFWCDLYVFPLLSLYLSVASILSVDISSSIKLLLNIGGILMVKWRVRKYHNLIV